MPRPWVDNEDGPLCSCGVGTIVKAGDKPGALCFGHTREGGAWIFLPDECPDDFVPWTDLPENKEDEIVMSNGRLLAGETKTVDGVFIAKEYAKYLAEVLRNAIEDNQSIPQYLNVPLAALYRVLRTGEAEDERDDD